MQLRITTLSENTAGRVPGLLAEWGLSMLAETDDLKILIDTGQSISVPHNAPVLGIDRPAITGGGANQCAVCQNWGRLPAGPAALVGALADEGAAQ